MGSSTRFFLPINRAKELVFLREYEDGSKLDPDDSGYRLFTISHQKGDLIFKSGWTHEFTQDGVVVTVDGAGDSYLINFGFLND